MANNRMFLVCGRCDSHSPTLAKYYPSTGWYTSAEYCIPGNEQIDSLEDWTGAFAEWLEAHAHEEPSNDGPTHFRLGYEG